MADVSKKEGPDKPRAAKPAGAGEPSAEELFKKATELHQQGDTPQAQSLYRRIVNLFPGSPKADLAKTLLAGMQKEKISVLWDAASSERSQCNTAEAIKLYQLIEEELPDSPEAKSAKAEMQVVSEVKQIWDAALVSQSEEDDARAIELYRQIIARYPQSPEADNAGLLISIIGQNQFIPQREVTYDLHREETTPETIVSHLLAHKQASSGSTGATPGSPDEELHGKVDKLWLQAVALQSDGKHSEAAVLYRLIISSSPDGYRVRDAKYRLEKIEALSGDFVLTPFAGGQKGADQSAAKTYIKKAVGHKWLLAGGLVLVVAAGGFLYSYTGKTPKPFTWMDAVENAKKSIVVVRTPDGAGSGFFVSPDGLIFTNAHTIGKNKEVQVRLYSGEIKSASVVRAGAKLLDIAILKVDGSNYPSLLLADADECREGDEIRMIGAPLGVEYFVTMGIISHCNQTREGVRFIQTNAAMSVANSGGPCLNLAGRVIGLSTPIQLGDNPQGLNLILPIRVVKDFMEGKLVALEEELIRRQEETARELEQKNSQFYSNTESITKRLQYNADLEFAAYSTKLDNLIRLHAITYDQGKLMMEQVRYAPSGSATIPQWIQTLALKIVKGEMKEEDAVRLIKTHYKL